MKSKIAEELLGRKKRFPSPSLSQTHKGHFKSFLEETINPEKVYGDKGQPTAEEKKLGSCSVCPNWAFKSKTEKTRHQNVFHRKDTPKAQQKENEQQKEFFCPFEGCDKFYESPASLSRHRTKEKHRARDFSEPQNRNANKKKTAKPKKTKKSHQTISDMLRQVGLYSFCSRELSYLFNFPKDFVEGHQRNVFKTIQYYFKKIFPSSPLYDSIWLEQLFVAQHVTFRTW